MKSKAAYVYAVEYADLVKVGSSIDPEWRWKTGIRKGRVAYISPAYENGRRVEKIAHMILSLAGARRSGEWFQVTKDVAVAAIERAARVVDGLEEAPEGVRSAEYGAILGCVIQRSTMEMLSAYVSADPANRSKASVVDRAIRELLAKRRRS